jgi:hypothetical protein
LTDSDVAAEMMAKKMMAFMIIESYERCYERLQLQAAKS